MTKLYKQSSYEQALLSNKGLVSVMTTAQLSALKQSVGQKTSQIAQLIKKMSNNMPIRGSTPKTLAEGIRKEVKLAKLSFITDKSTDEAIKAMAPSEKGLQVLNDDYMKRVKEVQGNTKLSGLKNYKIASRREQDTQFEAAQLFAKMQHDRLNNYQQTYQQEDQEMQGQ